MLVCTYDFEFEHIAIDNGINSVIFWFNLSTIPFLTNCANFNLPSLNIVCNNSIRVISASLIKGVLLIVTVNNDAIN